MRHRDNGKTRLIFEARLLVGEHEKLTAAGLHLFEVGFQFFQQFVVGRYCHHRHIVIHQRQGAVLELTGRIAFRVNIGNLL